jgi:hypothetical protein
MSNLATGSVEAGLEGFKYGSTDMLLDFISRSLRVELSGGNDSVMDTEVKVVVSDELSHLLACKLLQLCEGVI